MCVSVALVIQHAMRVATLSLVTLSALQYFPTLSHKKHNFRPKKKRKAIGHKMFVLFVSTISSETFLVQAARDEILSQISTGLHVKYPLFLSDFNETWIFSTDFSKYQLSVQFFYLQQYICYTTLLNMFQAARCSSPGGPIVSAQPLVSSPSVSSRTVCRLRADCIKIFM